MSAKRNHRWRRKESIEWGVGSTSDRWAAGTRVSFTPYLD
jgi:hypothetical protein